MDILEEFTGYIRQIGYGKGSRRQIPNCVKEFLEVTNKPFKSINQEDIMDFYRYLETRPLKRGTGALSEAMIAHYVSGLKTFFNWLEQSGQVKHNPISNIRFKSPRGNPREPLSQKEIQQLFEAAATAKETAILHLFYSCGLRRTEAENLNTADIHFNKNLLYVREGKGAKRRAIPINERVKKELENYHNHERTRIDDGAFVLNGTNRRMSGDSYNRALKKIIERTGINRETTLHHLRHSIATHLLENGLGIEFVRDFLGHSHLEATQIYAKVPRRLLKKL